MKAWLMDGDGAESPRAPHHRTPDTPVSLEELKHLGVLYWYLDPKEYSAGTSPVLPYPVYRVVFSFLTSGGYVPGSVCQPLLVG